MSNKRIARRFDLVHQRQKKQEATVSVLGLFFYCVIVNAIIIF